METTFTHSGIKYSCIGQINASEKITTTLNNKPSEINGKGFEHFTSNSLSEDV
jgi:thiamine-monophosphate kinase